jgi:thiol-disulfide isomerase/thioredoxin
MHSVSSKNELSSFLSENEKVLALFYSTWCPFCQEFLRHLKQEMGEVGYAKTLHVIVDDYDNPLWEEYSIEAVPTVIFFAHGNVSNRLDGRLGEGLSQKKFHTWLRQL